MVQFASYLRHVLCKMHLIFPHINDPIVTAKIAELSRDFWDQYWGRASHSGIGQFFSPVPRNSPRSLYPTPPVTFSCSKLLMNSGSAKFITNEILLHSLLFVISYLELGEYLTLFLEPEWALSQWPMRPKAEWVIDCEAMRARGIIKLLF